MEREIIDLGRENAELKRKLHQLDGRPNRNINTYGQTPSQPQWSGSDEAVASLLDLRSGFDGSNGYSRSPKGQMTHYKKLEDISITTDKVNEIFDLFFTFYHPFLPFLDPNNTPDAYYSLSPLLFWAIISVAARRYANDNTLLNSLAGPVTRLVWSTLADVPQNYHVVKALCLLCTWPFPTNSTSTDPTFMFCGIMMHIAMQVGLHRPSQAQDFSKFRIDLRDEELRDRVRTWAICNTVTQRVSTGYGQPSITRFDYTLSPAAAAADPNFALPDSILKRLKIEQYIDKVTQTLYSNCNDPLFLSKDSERTQIVKFLAREFDELESELCSDKSPITALYLRAASMHLRLSVFFSAPTLPSYNQELMHLYIATTSFLEAALSLDQSTGSAIAADGAYSTGSVSLAYSTIYIFQMMLAAGFALFKLRHSHFAKQGFIDLEYTKDIFLRTIWTIRNTSAAPNDLPQRLTEVLARVWKSGHVPSTGLSGTFASTNSQGLSGDEALRLRNKCRNSMSLVFDTVWRWREDYIARGKSMENFMTTPTDPATATDSGVTSIAPDGASGNPDSSMVAAAAGPLVPNPMIAGMPAMTTGIGTLPVGLNGLGYADTNTTYEVFDPLNWMLDGLVDIPYASFNMQGLDPNTG